MVTIIHGDDVVSSRNFLQDQKQRSADFVSFDGQFDLEDLIQATQGSGLFTNEKKIFIENFFSKNKINSTLTKNILDYVNKNNSLFELYLWEGKELQKKNFNQFDKPSVKTFMIPKTIFAFLESIRPGNHKTSIELFHNALQNTEPEIIFFMIQRQLRMLLCISDKQSSGAIEEVTRLAPWQIGKFERQAKSFNAALLLTLYNKVFSIELKLKTGGLPYSLDKAIDIFLLSF